MEFKISEDSLRNLMSHSAASVVVYSPKGVMYVALAKNGIIRFIERV